MSNDGLLLEDLDSKIDVVLEAVGQMRDEMKGMARQEDLEEVRADVRLIKTALTATNTELAEVKSDVKVIKAAVTNHEVRITHLETA